MPKFTAMHYNAIAKEIREIFPAEEIFGTDEATNIISRHVLKHERAILTTLALNFATRFEADNPNFNPHKFLNACSPDTDLYPLSELWTEEEA